MPDENARNAGSEVPGEGFVGVRAADTFPRLAACGAPHVWRARWAKLDRALPIEALDMAERARADRLRLPAHRTASLMSGAFLRWVLARYLACEAASVPIVRQEGGKPVLASAELAFNLSHCGDGALVAVGLQGALGIDLEVTARRVCIDTLAAAALTAREVHALPACGTTARRHAVLQAWTRKEAVLKACGSGLRQDPRSVEGPSPDGTCRIADGPTIHCRDLPLGPDWAGALASTTPIGDLRCFCAGW